MENQLQLALLNAESQHITTHFRFPFLAVATQHMAQRQSGLCLPLGSGLAHILPPIPWKPQLLLVSHTMLDKI